MKPSRAIAKQANAAQVVAETQLVILERLVILDEKITDFIKSFEDDAEMEQPDAAEAEVHQKPKAAKGK